MLPLASDIIEFRSVEEPEIEVIHKYQNGACRLELSDFGVGGDKIPYWAPYPRIAINEAFEKKAEKDRYSLMSIWTKGSEGEFIGIAAYDAGWDPWSPHISLLIWPKYRNKGYGREAARVMLSSVFGNTLAHVVSSYVGDWNMAGLNFALKMGFKEQGRYRREAIVEGKFSDGIFLDMLRREYSGSQISDELLKADEPASEAGQNRGPV